MSLRYKLKLSNSFASASLFEEGREMTYGRGQGDDFKLNYKN